MRTNKELIDSGFLKFQETSGQGGIGAIPMDRANGSNLPYILWNSSNGWDHVIASYSDRFFLPEEVELLKRLFFHPEELKSVIVEPAVLNDPRPYGISLWKGNEESAERPAVYDHIPHSLKKGPWQLKINPAYQFAIRFQASGNHITPEEYLSSLEDAINKLFDDTLALSEKDRKLKYSFYKKPSVEKFFLTMAEQAKRKPRSLIDTPFVAPTIKSDDRWKALFDPALYNAVVYQANGNRLSPGEYAHTIQRNINAAFNPLVYKTDNEKKMETILRSEFKSKPTVQQVFLFMVLAA